MPNKDIKKFRIKDERDNIVATSDYLQSCVDFVKANHPEENDFYIEDLEDGIGIYANEVVAAFDDGESPMDLQFF